MKQYDFYEDFYNILNDKEKDSFYSVWNYEDIEYMRPDEYFSAYYEDSIESLKSLIFEYIKKWRLQQALKNLYNKGILDGFDIDVEWNEWIWYTAFASLDDGCILNFENNSNDTFFEKAITVNDFEKIIQNDFENASNE